jgi:hypothetical protein
MIMANSCLTAQTYAVQLTVGRSTFSSATSAQSTNIVSNSLPLLLPATSTSYYMAAFPAINTGSCVTNLNGFALDSPGAGTFYYSIWMTSSTSYNYSTMTAALSVLKINN